MAQTQDATCFKMFTKQMHPSLFLVRQVGEIRGNFHHTIVGFCVLSFLQRMVALLPKVSTSASSSVSLCVNTAQHSSILIAFRFKRKTSTCGFFPAGALHHVQRRSSLKEAADTWLYLCVRIMTRDFYFPQSHDGPNATKPCKNWYAEHIWNWPGQRQSCLA